jgi:CubicO group peptidase (beta-lactamase class C family)
VVVRAGGIVVVDLCGGWADAARTRQWAPETVVDVFSTGKACVALTVLSLGLDLDARAWQEATLRQVLSHQAGQPAIRADVPDEAIYDWDWMVRALESQDPWWAPGSAHGYHVNTFGFMCGEIVRRATGEPLGERFGRLVGDQAGVTFGAPPAADVAEFVFDVGSDEATTGTKMDEATRHLLERAYFNPPGLSGIGTVNSSAWRSAEIPSANLHGSARGIAAVFARMPELLGEELLAEATQPWSDGEDMVLRRHTRFGLGFQLTQPDRPMGTGGERAYGHFGAGGSLGFHDPDADVVFAYVCNRCEGRRWQTARNRRLLEALAAAI